MDELDLYAQQFAAQQAAMQQQQQQQQQQYQQPPPPPPPEHPAPPPQQHGRTRRSRWNSPHDPKVFVPGLPIHVGVTLSDEALQAFIMRAKIDEITYKLHNGILDIPLDERDRSPSPPPQYDARGQRSNTREMRYRERLMRERQTAIERCQQLNPMFKPPADYRPLSNKKMRKLYIPVDKYPTVNFVGLLIGPRGITQKALEKETGAKIAVRGKGNMNARGGSVKDKGHPGDGSDEPLHVLITADTEESLQKAIEKVEPLLIPIDDEKNEHKRAQLRKLAEINGTLRDNMWNNQPVEPHRIGGIEVQCRICGEISHPTSDCPLKGSAGAVAPNKHALNSELDAFMSEIGEAQPKDDAAMYDEFMRTIGGSGSNAGAASAGAGVGTTSVASAPWQQSSASGSLLGTAPWQAAPQQSASATPWAAQTPAAGTPWAQQPFVQPQRPAWQQAPTQSYGWQP